MKPFAYFAPRTLAEAIEILASDDGGACALAGGTDLLLKMKAGKLAPRAVVNIKRVGELRGISTEDRRPTTGEGPLRATNDEGQRDTTDGERPTTNDERRMAMPSSIVFRPWSTVRIGALTTVEDLRRSPIVGRDFPALAHAASTMASVQIRNLATVGGNLCNAAPSADLAPILIALGAEALIAGPGGERRVPLEDFFVGPGKTVLGRGDLLLAVEVPPAEGRSVYLKHAPRQAMDIAVVGVGIALRTDGGGGEAARVVLGAVAPTPMRARRAEAELLDGPLTPERIERAAKIAAEESKPIDDVRGSAWYRRRMVEVLLRRGLLALAQIPVE